MIISPVAGFLLVTLNALNICMFAFEGKIRIVVVEFFGGRKLLRSMAFRAVSVEGVLVVVVVAVNAGSAEAQKGIFSFSQLPVFNKIGLMAVAAVNAGMCSGEVVASQGVVKVVFIKMYHVELASVVFAVTGGAVLPLYFPRGVKPRIFVEPAFYFFMAFEAFPVGYFIAQLVALCTIGEAFQLGVCTGKVARRDLGVCPAPK